MKLSYLYGQQTYIADNFHLCPFCFIFRFIDTDVLSIFYSDIVDLVAVYHRLSHLQKSSQQT